MTKKHDKEKYNPEILLEPIFLKAREKDEFEFCCSLLRIRGCEDAGWDPLIENSELINQLLSLIKESDDSKLRIRLLLFLYCHVTEIEDLYNVIGNLMRVCLGHRCSMSPFTGDLHSSGKPANSPYSKVKRLSEWSSEVDAPDIGNMLTYMLVRQVRNAFFHSDYVVHDNQFNIKYGDGVLVDHVITRAIPLDWLMPRIELGINFSLAFIGLIQKYMRSYKEEKVVKARILHNDEVDDMLLTIKPGYGLAGFRSLTKEEKEKYKSTKQASKE
jgi:hypothetical protein